MESRANYLLIGGVALVSVAAVVIFALWLAEVGFGRDQQRYRVVFEDSVGGLQTGATVRFKGVDVGSVTGIRLAPEDPRQVQVDIEVLAKTPLHEGATASIGLGGITGRPHISLSPGEPDAPLLEGEDDEPPVIAAEASDIAELMESVPRVAERMEELAGRASDLLGEEQAADVQAILGGVRAVTDQLAERDRAIGRILEDLSEASAAMNNAAQKADELMDVSTATMRSAEATFAQVEALVDEEVTPFVSDGREAAASLADLTAELDQIVAENRGPINAFTSEGLLEFRHFVNEARLLVDDLSQVAERLREGGAADVLFDRDGAEFTPETGQ